MFDIKDLVWALCLFVGGLLMFFSGISIGKKEGYTDAVRDIIDKGQFKSVEEVHGD